MYNASWWIKAEGSLSLMFSVVQVLCLHSAGLVFRLLAQLFLVRIGPYFRIEDFSAGPGGGGICVRVVRRCCRHFLRSSIIVGQIILSLVLGSQLAPMERYQNLYIVFLNISKEHE